jgi:diguanylate cyclase (GGDEF)-like protein
MIDLFAKEEEVLNRARELVRSGVFESANDAGHYRKLLEEYQDLLNQMRRLVKMSDLTESRLNKLLRKQDQLSKIDFLTNLYNRRFFDEYFQKKWQSSLNSREFLSLLVIDIDYFKRYNDLYGHLEGDRCLQAVALAITGLLDSPHDIAARFGGEEFVVLLPGRDVSGTWARAESIRACIEALAIPVEGLACPCKVTVSIGLAVVQPREELAPGLLIRAADEALYLAKKEGRNCVREGAVIRD